MRLCRYQHNGDIEVALYFDDKIVNLNRTAEELNIRIPQASLNILDYLPEGRNAQIAQRVLDAYNRLPAADQRRLSRPMKEVQLRVPVGNTSKIILLAGNYNDHIKEGGGQTVTREETYPYFFWKPPTTTLTDPGNPIIIPHASPDHIDWEIELGVVIGRRGRHIPEREALRHVAGYTVCNDVSDRQFQLNPKRKPRDRDRFYDWLHGKWHDTFLPTGPCVTAATAIPDPQKLRLTLKVNGKVMQDASTAQMIFPVAAIISILSTFVTLEPGDMIVTGTPSGVGAARKPPVFLQAKDVVEAEIEGIGLLRNPVSLEKA